jgi:hypothetical protein
LVATARPRTNRRQEPPGIKLFWDELNKDDFISRI